MKIGIDGVLLGAWANFGSGKNILDIGSGTGLLSLMAAQRTNAKITALEIEENAALESKTNFENSKWSDRLLVEHCSFQEFFTQKNSQFGAIISNPPFFENSLQSKFNNRNLARHTDSLPFDELLKGVKISLSNSGIFSLIIPAQAAKNYIEKAVKYRLFVSRKTWVKPLPNKKGNRVLLEFRKTKATTIQDEITIRNIDSTYTDAYKKLTVDFYSRELK